MFAFKVMLRFLKVMFPASPSANRSFNTSLATVPSMKPTPARPSFKHVRPARYKYQCHGIRVAKLVNLAT